MDEKIAAMKAMFMEIGGDEAAWEHIEMHIRQTAKGMPEVAATPAAKSAPVTPAPAAEVKTSG